MPIVARCLPAKDFIAQGVNAAVVMSQEWFNDEGYKVDIAKSNSYGIALENFGNWSKRHSKEFKVSGK